MKLYVSNKIKIPKSFFLTHTVQMKLSGWAFFSGLGRPFLTHTVQMKLYFCAKYLTNLDSFLTHTVQMKPALVVRQ